MSRNPVAVLVAGLMPLLVVVLAIRVRHETRLNRLPFPDTMPVLAEYYVQVDGRKDSLCEKDTPCTFERALDLMASGQIICGARVNLSGTFFLRDPLHIRGGGTERLPIQWQGRDATVFVTFHDALLWFDASYTWWSDFTVTSSKNWPWADPEPQG